MQDEALRGTKVVTFEQGVAGPLLTAILAGYGAQVIRIESGTRLEWHRQVGPFLGNTVSANRAVAYLFVNAGKYGVSLNLKKPEATELARRIVGWADVVVENFAGGVMAKLGLGYEDLSKVKPDIIMLSADIYGQTGPLAEERGHGNQLAALAALPHLTGFADQPPQFPGFTITDFTAPRVAVLAVVSALDYRRRTGKGQYIDASQFESAVHLLTPVLLECQLNGRQASRMGNRSDCAAPHGVYRCKGDNRWCAITLFTEEEWARFCQVVGNPAWVKSGNFATLSRRLENQDELDRLIDEWTQNHSAEEVMSLMQAAGLAAGVVQNSQDLDNDPQLKHRQFYWKLDHPDDMGTFSYSGLPARLSRTPYNVKRAPMLGEHNEEVFTGILGMSHEEFARLNSEGVFL